MEEKQTNSTNLAKLSIGNSAKKISLYGKGKLTKKSIHENVNKLKLAFPELENEWFAVLINRLGDNNFTDQRLNDAVNKVIDTFIHGKTPHIANIIQYDLKIGFLTYNEMIELINKHGLTTDDFQIIRSEKKPKWIKKTIYQKYKHLIDNIL